MIQKQPQSRFANYLVKLSGKIGTIFSAPTTALTKSDTKSNSLAYLAFQYRKQKGLISSDNADGPVFYFEDCYL